MKVLTAAINYMHARRSSSKYFPFPMRSWFFPKKSKPSLEKSAKLKPDVVILDLEDSITSCEKPGVRKLYLEALTSGIFSNMNVFVRVSSLQISESDLQEDIKTFVGSGIKGFVLPKVECPQNVLDIDGLISLTEEEKGITPSSIKLVPVVESPPAYFCLDKIASASGRNVSLHVGNADLIAETLCSDHSPTNDAYLSKLVLAAKSTGITSGWGAYDKIYDYAGFEKTCLKLKQFGFNGLITLTPKQIVLANYIFSMSPKEKRWVDNALKESYNSNALKIFKPSAPESWQMIGPPHVKKAKNMQDQMEQLIEIKPLSPTLRGIFQSKGMSQDISVGEIVRSPLKVSVSEGLKTAWASSFVSQDGAYRLQEGVNPSDKMIPFTLAATVAGTLSIYSQPYHANANNLNYELSIFQHRALKTGDTVQSLHRIEEVESKKDSDGNLYSVVLSSTHWLVNQTNDVIVQFRKTTLDGGNYILQPAKATCWQNVKSLKSDKSLLCESILQKPVEWFFPPTFQPPLNAGNLLVHDFVKVIGHSEIQTLCSLFTVASPLGQSVPEPFVMAAAIANSAKDMGETLYEEIPLCLYMNKVNFGDQIGTLTYVTECEELEGRAGFEKLTVKHMAVRNCDMEILSQMNIPLSFFLVDKMKPSEIESLCITEFPILLNKIVCIIVRKIIRVQPGLQSPIEIPQELC